MKNKKILVFMVFLFLLNNSFVNAEPLIEIGIGDNWVYEYSDDSDFKTYKGEIITCNVTDTMYVPSYNEELTEMKVNKIVYNHIIDEYKINSFSNKTIKISNMGILGGYADLYLSFNNPKEDTILKTSRGNILYKRVTVFDLSLKVENIFYNNSFYNKSYSYTINNVEFTEESSNPSIIETIATGSVQINKRRFQIDKRYFINDFINENETLSINNIAFYIEERYEASNEFKYQNKNCRNISITQKRIVIEMIDLIGESKGVTNNWGVFSDYELPMITYKENWIYSYDIGLPLYIDKIKTDLTKQSLSYDTNKQVDISPKVIMKLIGFDIQNALIDDLTPSQLSNFYFWSSIFMIIVVIVTVAVTYVVTKNK